MRDDLPNFKRFYEKTLGIPYGTIQSRTERKDDRKQTDKKPGENKK